ncbi:NAD-dependent epimerase/dehydratase family protein [Micromonospora inyonensis]|uniref:CDP-glucose 4,6-dehydratase n=1 Tax=Micromonospora inyonensis TaxID=47866 RepID=A0A1C6RLV3_9ACTN|nr:NAD-dependent epimerase/dehydratase family protein [Micromonospora inyonensis]SCL18026.1 CDP-glucose 4,6-dehydratase [Micromonospora inyonensis]
MSGEERLFGDETDGRRERDTPGGGFSFWADRRCLVTGGYGFGGSHLVARLLELGASVVVLDRVRRPESYLSRAGLEPHVTIVQADIRDAATVEQVIATHRVQDVFHLAAQPLVPLSVAEPAETLDVNANGTFILLEAVRRAGTIASFVFASSGAYYGEHHDDRALREDDPARVGRNLYGASKIAADMAVQAYARTYGLPASVCRFMNTYGPGDQNKGRLIPHAIRTLAAGKPYEFGHRDDGSTQLDFLYVSDMVEGYLAAAERLAIAPGSCYNFGTGTATGIADVARMVSERYDGVRREPTFGGPPRTRSLRKRLDVTRAATELGWQARVSLAEGLDLTLSHARGWPR